MAGELQFRVGQNLRAHRHRRRLSQEAFAYQLEVHRSYVGGVERGDRNITLRTLERIAEQLGVDPADLMRPLDEI